MLYLMQFYLYLVDILNLFRISLKRNWELFVLVIILLDYIF